MSSGPETRFLNGVHAVLKGRDLYFMKNHNPYVGGVADCWYSGAAGDLWVEYKYEVLPKRPSTIVDLTAGAKPPLTKLQQEWLAGRHAEGRRVGVIIGTPNGGVWLPGLTWQRPQTSSALSGQLLSKRELAEIIMSAVCPPRPILMTGVSNDARRTQRPDPAHRAATAAVKQSNDLPRPVRGARNSGRRAVGEPHL